MFQCRLIGCKQCTPPEGDVNVAGGCVCVVGGVEGAYRKSLYLLLSFAMNLKLSNKQSLLKQTSTQAMLSLLPTPLPCASSISPF